MAKFKRLKVPDGTIYDVEGTVDDISDTTSNIDSITTDYPDISASDKTSTLFGKIKKFLSDLKSNKQNTITGAATTITSSNLTANRILQSDANGKVAVSGYQFDLSTANTTDTWIPVMKSSLIQHRVLSASKGSATQPIYMVNGDVAACTYTLSKSVPSNAVFTDTNTWRGIQNNLTSTSTTESLSAAQGKWLNDNKISGTSNGSGYYNVTRINTFNDTNNALIQGGKGNFIWGISSWSDSRLKKNIKDSKVNGLDTINQIHLHEFDFIDNYYGTHESIGYIADELKELIPEAVISVPQDKNLTGYDELYQVLETPIIRFLIKAVQELSAKVDVQADLIFDLQQKREPHEK